LGPCKEEKERKAEEQSLSLGRERIARRELVGRDERNKTEEISLGLQRTRRNGFYIMKNVCPMIAAKRAVTTS